MSGTVRSRPLTFEEYYALPADDGRKHELQGGVLVSEPLPGFRQGCIAMSLGALLQHHVCKHDLGLVTGEAGYLLARSPLTLRGPDVAFVAKPRLAGIEESVRAFPGAPDLAIEVLSPSNTPAAIHAKVADYLAAGTRLVWVVDGDARVVTVYESLLEPRRLGPTDRLDGGDVVRGFSITVADIFRGAGES